MSDPNVSVTPPNSGNSGGGFMGGIGTLIIVVCVIGVGVGALYFLPGRKSGTDLAERQTRSRPSGGEERSPFVDPPEPQRVVAREEAPLYRPGRDSGRDVPRTPPRPRRSRDDIWDAPGEEPARAQATANAGANSGGGSGAGSGGGGPAKPETLGGMPVIRAEYADFGTWYLMPGNIIMCRNVNPITERSGAFWSAEIPEEVRGRDGTEVLIPRMSTAFGKIMKGIDVGERRLVAVVSHIEGPSIPGRKPLFVNIGMGQVGDELGRVDMEGNINTHFLSKLGTVGAYVALDTVARIGAGVAANSINDAVNGGGRSGGNNTNVNVGNFGGMANGRSLAGDAMQEQMQRKPSFDRPQAAPCSIMITQPIDFRRK